MGLKKTDCRGGSFNLLPVHKVPDFTFKFAGFKKRTLKWDFKVSNPLLVDWDLITKYLTSKSPLIFVEIDSVKYFLLHKTFYKKVKILELLTPDMDVVQSKNSAVHLIEYDPKKQYSEIISWAKKVKMTKWKQMKNITKVSVFVPNI